MLGFAGVPSLLMFVGLLFMPESPRWLVFHGRKDQAQRVLRKIHPPEDVGRELQRIMEDYKNHKQAQLGEVPITVTCTGSLRSKSVQAEFRALEISESATIDSVPICC